MSWWLNCHFHNLRVCSIHDNLQVYMRAVVYLNGLGGKALGSLSCMYLSQTRIVIVSTSYEICRYSGQLPIHFKSLQSALPIDLATLQIIEQLFQLTESPDARCSWTGLLESSGNREPMSCSCHSITQKITILSSVTTIWFSCYLHPLLLPHHQPLYTMYSQLTNALHVYATLSAETSPINVHDIWTSVDRRDERVRKRTFADSLPMDKTYFLFGRIETYRNVRLLHDDSMIGATLLTVLHD